MPTSIRLLLTAAAIGGCLLAFPTSANAAIGWTNARGVVAGNASTNQKFGQILSSVAMVQKAATTAFSGPAPACTWETGIEAAGRLLPPRSVGLVPADRVEPDGTRSILYAQVCGNVIAQWQWLRAPAPTDPAAVAEQAIRRQLPTPRPVFSPAATAAVVNVPLWFAVPAQWVPVTAAAAVPGAAITVNATPISLEFSPGDGGAPVSCIGPGPVFNPSAAKPVAPPACSYIYRDASTAAPDGRAWHAVLTIKWRVSWQASNGQTGTLAPITTATATDIVVGQIQAIEQAGG